MEPGAVPATGHTGGGGGGSSGGSATAAVAAAAAAAAVTPSQPPYPFDDKLSGAVPGTAPSTASPASALASVPSKGNPSPASVTLQQPPHTASPHKRRNSQASEPATQAGGSRAETGEASAASAAADPHRLTSPPSTHSLKRSKPDAAPPKVLPARYEFCATEDMVVLIANMLGELIETNDTLALTTGHLTRFHSRTPPGISVLDYLQRLAKHATLTPPLLLSMVYYIDRLCAMYPVFTINTLTVHRFLITAATVAAKGLSDSFWNNSTYARVGGVRVAELKMLELEFLYRLDWKIVPNPEVLDAYYRPLVERCPGYALPPDTASSRDEDAMDDDSANDRQAALHIRRDRQSSTSLIGEDMVVSGMTLHGSR